MMRTITTYSKRAPFYNAFIGSWRTLGFLSLRWCLNLYAGARSYAKVSRTSLRTRGNWSLLPSCAISLEESRPCGWPLERLPRSAKNLQEMKQLVSEDESCCKQ